MCVLYAFTQLQQQRQQQLHATATASATASQKQFNISDSRGRGNSFSAGIANNTVWQSLQLTRPPATGQETHNIL